MESTIIMANKAITISRTIYDPAIKDFITSSDDTKALPNVKQWITDKNPVIYWYILRIDNPPDADISQWAVELYAHQALTITEAYVDGSDRKFELKKREHDAWNEKYVLSIPRQIGIPIVGKGTRRIFFKVDIDCKEGLMHEYGISGKFVAQGMEPVKIKEKMFQYSCKVGEFRQIFDKDPHEASDYAEKRLSWKYSTDSVHVFTNSFRMIHELYGYCHSKSVDRGVLLQKLHLLHTSFENVPEIAGKRITPLIHDGILELDVIVDRDKFAPRFIRLCDSLVELLHIEVMGAEIKKAGLFMPSAEVAKPKKSVQNNEQYSGNGIKECSACGNIISESNKYVICKKCGTKFCTTCEEWFRGERKRGQKPLCEGCFTAEKERAVEEIRSKQKVEDERKAQAELERKEKAEQDARDEIIERERKVREIWDNSTETTKIRTVHFEKSGFLGLGMKKIEIENKIELRKNSFGMKFTHIPAGEFMMGSNELATKPVHKVFIKKPFYLGNYPVTQKEWKAVMRTNPSHFKGDNLPVECVSWDDVQNFIKKLNEKENVNKYRLPSEAEWEYACRAGTTTKYSFGDNHTMLYDYAWYKSNSGSETHDVGQKKPNLWGLYDMHGNVFEWTQDKYHSNYYYGVPTDGSAWESGGSSERVIRGGSWLNHALYGWSANRFSGEYDSRFKYLGFRLLRSL